VPILTDEELTALLNACKGENTNHSYRHASAAMLNPGRES
jgi:hypothetical protein